MDFDSLKAAAANLSLYDIKAGVRKVQNAVMNYTEMEAKVREATNNEPWGCSSSTMQEIANGTYNYTLLNEIMPMIYKRFTEKSAEEWRQIYKALQLLEYLIKNGSERVIDDARGHLTLLKMLRQFHYIDMNGKDQGINVRNRADELAKLLSDVDKIRAERKKARANKSKYVGVEGGAGSSSTSRYGGFASDSGASYGGYSGGVYGDGGGFGGQRSDFQDAGHHGEVSSSSRKDRYEEYDEYDEGAVAAPSRQRTGHTSHSSTGKRKKAETTATKPPPATTKAPEVDLFSFDDSIPTSAPSAPSLGLNNALGGDEDDFDDFQSAGPTPAPPSSNVFAPPIATTSAATQFAAPQPVSAPQVAGMNDLVGFNSISPAPTAPSTTAGPNYSAFKMPPTMTAPSTQAPAPQPQQQQQPIRPTGYQGVQVNYFTSVPAPSQGSASGMTSPSGSSAVKSPPAKSSAGGDAFGSLWSTASVGIKKSETPGSGPALGQLQKEKASAGIWGTASGSGSSSTPMALGMGSSSTSAQGSQNGRPQQSLGNGLDDLLG